MRKRLTPKRGICRWKHHIRLICMQRTPSRLTLGSKRRNKLLKVEDNMVPIGIARLKKTLKSTSLYLHLIDSMSRTTNMRYQLWLLGNPASHNENYQLEHTRAWEPSWCLSPTRLDMLRRYWIAALNRNKVNVEEAWNNSNPNRHARMSRHGQWR